MDQLEADAIATMARYGLHVTAYSDETEAAWVNDVNRYQDALLDVFDPDMTRRIRDLLAGYTK